MRRRIKSKFIKGGIVLTISQASTQICLLFQSVLYARLLSPSDVGIASTFLLTVSVIDVLRNVGLEKLLVQAEDGREPHFLATAHSFQLLRGLTSAMILVCLGGYVARLFGTPNAAWAYRSLAAVPVLISVVHLDYACMQRALRFGPSLIIDVCSNIVGLVFAAGLAWQLHSFAAALWALLARSATGAIASHYLAEQKYRLGWDVRVLSKIFHFGWPLVVNGLLILVIYQGDRFLIASAKRLFGRTDFKMADLAVFAVATAVSGVPTGMLANVLSALLLPYFASCRSDRQIFSTRVRFSMKSMGILAMFIATALSMMGPVAIGFVYGPVYLGCKPYFGWLVASQAVRMLRIVPTLSLMADADTRNGMYSNVCRAISLALAFGFVSMGGDIVGIAILSFSGECAGWIVSMILLHRRQPFLLSNHPLMPSCLAILLSGALTTSVTFHCRDHSTCSKFTHGAINS